VSELRHLRPFLRPLLEVEIMAKGVPYARKSERRIAEGEMTSGIGSALRGGPAATKGRKRKMGAVTAQAVSGPAGGSNTANKLAVALGLGAQAVMGPFQQHPFAQVGGMVVEHERGKAYGGALSALLAGEEPDKGQVEMLSPQQVDKLSQVQLQLKKGKMADLTEAMKLVKQVMDADLPEAQQNTAIGNIFKVAGLDTPLAKGLGKGKGALDVAKEIITAETEGKVKVEGEKRRTAKEVAEIRGGWDEIVAHTRAAATVDAAEIRAATSKYGADKQTQRFMEEMNRRFTKDPEKREDWTKVLGLMGVALRNQLTPDPVLFKETLVDILKLLNMDEEAVGIARDAGIKAEGGEEEGGELSDSWLFEGLE